MRTLLGFLSLLALGLMGAVVIVLAMSGGGALTVKAPFPNGFRLDYASLVLGLVLGVGMATVARMSWAELPRRIVIWLVTNERNFYRVAWAGLLIGIILFY